MFQSQYRNEGISIIELLVVTAVLAVTLASLLSLAVFSLKASNITKETVRAKNIAEGTLESVRNFRDETNWNSSGLGSLTAGMAYHPEKSAGTPQKWILAEGEETIDGFIRKVIFDDVQRDTEDNIAESEGINDPDTKKVTVAVLWKEKEKTSQIEIITYLTNWKQ
jgi:type II secretory pathway pseudopilin PulG